MPIQYSLPIKNGRPRSFWRPFFLHFYELLLCEILRKFNGFLAFLAVLAFGEKEECCCSGSKGYDDAGH